MLRRCTGTYREEAFCSVAMARNKNKQRGDTHGPCGRHRRTCGADGAGAGLTAARLDSLCLDDNEAERVRVHCFV